MDRQETIAKAKDFYEAGQAIGDTEHDTLKQKKQHIGVTLDDILRQVVEDDKSNFQLIKTRSRKRSLRDYKRSYVKAAVKQGYT